MQRRQGSIVDSEVFLPAVSMGPRYKSLLNTAQRKEAMEFLQALLIRLDRLSLGGQNDGQDNVVTSPLQEDQQDVLEALLKKHRQGRSRKEGSILQILSEYYNLARVPKEVDVLKYWYERRLANPTLFRSLEAILALPVTQVSVERTFSHLKQILTMIRLNLSSVTK